ncbi:hypothetical protein CLOM_g12557 [Closterium sp. NIES-68]|nr:hypothetical protein CLOM_g2379 [Closterium sp. NIES-68]GJP33898.1 hypothetical protein CLOM_g18401 [Closterium sp. NIES-68]GJP35671.1 hypothetical protein CLOM_g20188 [Closterium sp. NIES-68]GJP39730.1 hypothetical protein CLOM_g24073 [Closterium sp. NIES-68]GJP53410.1 hypothetical protein CLOM_g12557 [Closterium sp. NIES-68]
MIIHWLKFLVPKEASSERASDIIRLGRCQSKFPSLVLPVRVGCFAYARFVSQAKLAHSDEPTEPDRGIRAVARFLSQALLTARLAGIIKRSIIMLVRTAHRFKESLLALANQRV